MSLVGSYVALSKPMVVVFPVFLLAWLRFGIGALAMAGWLKPAPGEAPMTPSTRAWVFMESLLGNFLFSICMLFGVRLTSAVAAGIIMAAIPAAVALLSRLFLKERLSPATLAAVACAALGIGLMGLTKPEGPAAGGDATALRWLGNALVFAAVLCEAAYAVIGKRLTGVLGAKRISALINLWGLALVTPLGLWSAWRFDFGAVAAPIWILLLFYGLAASVWTVWLWMTGLRTVPASQAGVFTVMLPVSACLVGVGLLGETLQPLQLLALAVSLLGVVLATRPVRPSVPAARR